jgi:hypothetical protein
VYVAFAASGWAGVSVATVAEASRVTVADTGVGSPDFVSVNVVEFTEVDIAFENVTVGATSSPTPVAPFVGVFPVTVGAVAWVVNVHVTALASATPSAAWIAVLAVTVYCVPKESGTAGVNVAIVSVASNEIVPAIGPCPNGLTVNVMSLNVEVFIGRENVALGLTVTAIPVAPAAGSFPVTVGGAAAVVKVHCIAETSATPSNV